MNMADYKVSDTDLIDVADAIRAKTGRSADLEFPDEFVSEIGSISGGGINIGILSTPIPNLLNMFYALEHGTAVTGEFTLSQTIPNTETLMFSTGLSTVHGLLIVDESQDTLNTGNTPENTFLAMVFNPTSEGGADYALTRLNVRMAYGAGNSSNSFLNRCSWSVRNGNLYCTGTYNRHATYTPFAANHTYRWVAW